MSEIKIPNTTKIIRQTIFEVSKDKYYTFDVDETTNFQELKKILCNAAHFRKNSFRIYHNGIDCTYNYEDQNLLTLFPEEQKIYFTLIKINDFEEEEDFSIKINSQLPCSLHQEKFLIFYCYTCKKSICKNCFDESHKNHNVKEKYDYLAPTKMLINKIFSNNTEYIADDKIDKTFFAYELKERLNSVIFEQLKRILTQIIYKINDVIDHFNNYVVQTKENTNENFFRLKDFSIDAYKALKADINTNKIIINDDIFLTLDEKIKEIERSKSILKDNVNQYIEINNNFEKIKELVEYIYTEIFNCLNNMLNLNTYTEIKNNINRYFVKPIVKNDIMEKMFSNIKVARKSLNQKDIDNSQHISSNKKNIENQSNINYQTQFTNYNNLNQNISDNSSGDTKIFSFTQPNFLDNLSKGINSSTQNINTPGNTNYRNSLFKGDMFIYPIILTNTILVENNEGCEERTVNFPSIGNLTSFLDKCAFCNYDNKLYISGGIEKNNTYSNIFLKYDPLSKTLNLNSRLINKRANHSMIGYNNIIYAIGGINSNKCEKYNNIKWESMPDLNEKEVQLPMLYIYNNYLYSFGGFNKNNILSTIERINLRNNRGKWEYVSYLNPDNIDNQVYCCGLIERDNELLFLGGKKGNSIMKNSFKFNFLTNTYYFCDFIFETEVYFKECPFRDIGDNYANINENGRLPLVFDLSSNY